ncbi:MAG: ATP-binding protein, partial [Campylobacterales bacterium]|nr:ATP-binding protein [Campylobacterales bacterium]
SEEVMGKNCRFLQKDDREQEAIKKMKQAVIKEETVTVVIRNYSKSGRLVYNEVTISPIFDKNTKKIKYFLGIQKDVTKEQLEVQNSKLQALEEMIRNIAHQWRQPLNCISLNISSLVESFYEKKATKEVVVEVSDEINQSISYLSKTIDDFRKLAKPNSEKYQFDVLETFKNIKDFVEPALQNDGISLELILPEDEIVYFGYENELSQIVLNLIFNSKEAIINNKIENGLIKLQVSKKDSNLEIINSDNGGGVLAEVIDSLFEPYSTTKFNSQGVGLGLYYSKVHLEEYLGGKISFKSINNGAQFTVILPLKN